MSKPKQLTLITTTKTLIEKHANTGILSSLASFFHPRQTCSFFLWIIYVKFQRFSFQEVFLLTSYFFSQDFITFNLKNLKTCSLEIMLLLSHLS